MRIEQYDSESFSNSANNMQRYFVAFYVYSEQQNLELEVSESVYYELLEFQGMNVDINVSNVTGIEDSDKTIEIKPFY